jgi:putative phage-type endonuclease
MALRRGRVTASVAGAILGVDPHKSAKAAWREVLGTSQVAINRWMNWGIEREGEAVTAYEQAHGVLVDRSGFWSHPLIPWIGASPDALVGEDGTLEVKCLTNMPERAPIQYRIQCLLQLIVTGRKWAHLWIWCPPQTRVWVIHHPSPQGQCALLARLWQWYQDYVIKAVEPPRKKPRRKKRARGTASPVPEADRVKPPPDPAE